MTDRPTITILTGGQTGGDRAALDAALVRGIPCGGWCPAGRLAEDGIIPDRYPVTPLSGGSYEDRTRRNVADSDATAILCFGPPFGGTETTRAACVELHKPLLLLDAGAMTPAEAGERIAEFVRSHEITHLNLAGPRESEQPAITAYVRVAVGAALDQLNTGVR